MFRKGFAGFQPLIKRQLTTSRKPFPVLPQSAQTFPDPNPVALEAAEEHRNLVERCRNGGGARGIERHVKKNKKVLVRERVKIEALICEHFFMT